MCRELSILKSRTSAFAGRWYTEDAPQQPIEKQHGDVGANSPQVLYKGRWMLPFRVLVRLKIFQLGGVAACAVPLGTFLTEARILLLAYSWHLLTWEKEWQIYARQDCCPPVICISGLCLWNTGWQALLQGC